MGQHSGQEILRYASAREGTWTLIFPLASGSEPNRLGPLVPLRQKTSTKPQTLRPNPTALMINTAVWSSNRSDSLPSRLGAIKNSAIHQPLLLRSCSRLVDMAAKHHVLMMRIGPIVPASNASVRGIAHFGSA